MYCASDQKGKPDPSLNQKCTVSRSAKGSHEITTPRVYFTLEVKRTFPHSFKRSYSHHPNSK